MHISKVQIKNFRNLRDLTVELREKAVLLGENGAGKSNFLEALRLVLDPNYRGALGASDFSRGVQPFKGTTIEVHIWFSVDQDKDKDLLPFAHDCRVSEEGKPLEIKLSAVYRPRPNVKPEDAVDEEGYQIVRYAAGDEQNTEGASRLRRFVKLLVVPALRDIERDMQSWRVSPMRRLVEIMGLSKHSTFKDVARQVKDASDKLQSIDPIQQLQKDIRDILGEIVESAQPIDPTIGLLSSDPDDLLKMLTLFVETGLPLERSSLGISNVLYLITWLVYLERLRTSSKPDEPPQFVILAIEEPEAHLHPHLQRLVFTNVFRRDHPVLVSTHSPTIVSVAQPEWFVLFKRKTDGVVVRSTSQIAQLDEKLRRDLSRFLDATRGEVVFARGVLLVEGDAEAFLIPAMARKMREAGKIANTLDGAGISVCNVYGTDFQPYVKFLGPSGLDLPVAVLTDGDPDEEHVGDDNNCHYAGIKRGIELAQLLNGPSIAQLQSDYQQQRWTDARNGLQDNGIFVNEHTLEAELIWAGYSLEFVQVYAELRSSSLQQKRMKEDIQNQELGKVIKRIEQSGIGKGRFAQRLADKVDAGKIPPYIEGAIQYILARVSQQTSLGSPEPTDSILRSDQFPDDAEIPF